MWQDGFEDDRRRLWIDSRAVVAMNLTRRGTATLVVAVVSVSLLVTLGQSGLAIIGVAAGGSVLLAIGYVRSLEPPTASRSGPSRGVVGERISIRLDLETARPFPAFVRDRVGAGLDAETNRSTMIVNVTSFSYDLALVARGEHHVGPIDIVARDPFGLVERSFRCESIDPVVVYPRVRPIDPLVSSLLAPAGAGDDPTPTEFERLREYRHGDPLGTISWKATAKRPDTTPVVADFGAAHRDDIVLAAEGPPTFADTLAELVASVGIAMIDEGARVRLVTPGTDPNVRGGTNDHFEFLEWCARIPGGRLPEDDRRRATLRIVVENDTEATFHVGDRELTLDWPADPDSTASLPAVDVTPGGMDQ